MENQTLSNEKLSGSVKDNSIHGGLRPDSGVESQPGASREKPGRLHLAYLDGLRGATALYVLLHHIYADVIRHVVLPRSAEWCTAWLAWGHYSVGVFIVLSGYSLMLPVARSGELSGGLKVYIMRRARRILPPYYAALILTLLCALAVPALNRPSDTGWATTALPMFSKGVLLSHFLLVHNLNPAWTLKLNAPFWSVATEWQIYFFFPLVLLPIWKRFGNLVVLAVALAIGWGLGFFFKQNLAQAFPIYVALFACGMVAAAVNFPSQRETQGTASRLPWGSLVCVFGVVLALTVKYKHITIWPDVMIGFTVAALLIYCTRAITERPAADHPLIVRVLGSPAAMLLGKFSYSLYLTHLLIETLVHLALNQQGVPATTQLALLPLIAIPLCLIGAYGFYLVFERPLMSNRR